MALFKSFTIELLVFFDDITHRPKVRYQIEFPIHTTKLLELVPYIDKEAF